MYTCEPWTACHHSASFLTGPGILEQKPKYREPQLCSIIHVYFGASRVLGTVRNGQERFRRVPGSRGLCVLLPYSALFVFLVWRALLPKASQEHETSMTYRKQRVRKFSSQEAPMPHAWPPESKYKGGKDMICCGMIMCRPSAPPFTWTCKMSGGHFPTSGSISLTISLTLRVVWMARREAAKYFKIFGPLFFIFGGAMLRL